MANYAEQYPKCANCPRLQEWQVSRDAMTSRLEDAQIQDNLRHIARQNEIERMRVMADEMYADMLDRAEKGIIAESDVREAKQLYANLEEATREMEMQNRRAEAFAGEVSDFMTELADNEVALQTDGCWGALEVSFLGFHKVFCRSRAPRSLAIHPPLPPLK